jgi:hypothetical protein
VTAGDHWVPAASGVPVAGYVVSRDGVDVGTVTTTSWRDRPRRDPKSDLTLTYEVAAIDGAGNRSDPAPVVVELPADQASRTPGLVGFALVGLATICAGLAARHAGLLGARRRGRHQAYRPAARTSGSVTGSPLE